MKKYLILLSISAGVFVGCAAKMDKCTLDKQKCEAECKVNYPDSDFKYKACIAKCGTFYVGCKTKEKAKEGYEKTKEYFNKD
jgi:hypothetical protein